MISLLLDTNIILDTLSACVLELINCNLFSVSNVVLNSEILKQVPNLDPVLFEVLKETIYEVEMAVEYTKLNKKISFYDALNLSLAKERNMTLVTGDQQLLKVAKENNVNCFGTIKLLELMIEEGIITPSNCIEALEKLKIDSTRRLPRTLIESAIEKIKEKYIVKVN